MACAAQEAIVEVLVKKIIRAAKEYKVKSIIIGGGVAANNELRKQLSYELQVTGYRPNFLIPPKNLCTDNAQMIAITAYYYSNKGVKIKKEIRACSSLRIS